VDGPSDHNKSQPEETNAPPVELSYTNIDDIDPAPDEYEDGDRCHSTASDIGQPLDDRLDRWVPRLAASIHYDACDDEPGDPLADKR
jgi:hypothetical protein